MFFSLRNPPAFQGSFNYIDDGSSLVYGRITTDAKEIYMDESFFSKEAVIYVENFRHLVLPNWYIHV